MCLFILPLDGIKDVDNKWIPTVIFFEGTALNCIVSGNVTVETVVAGAVCGLASTGLHQLLLKLSKIHSQGVASDHGDPDHWWKFVGYTMNDFRADVADCIANGNVNVSYGNTVKPTQPQTSEGYTTGKTYTLQTELKVRTGAGTNYRAKSHSELTVDGRKHDADGDGALDKGTRVSCLEVAKNGDDIWIRTPSGWLAAYYNGNRYISGEAVSNGSSTSQTKPSNASKSLGTYEVTANDLSVRTGPGTNYPRKTYAELSTDAKKHDYDKDGCLNKGTRVTVKEWKNGFARIPSGWVSGNYLKKV